MAEFKKDAPVSYAMALHYAQDRLLDVLIERTVETGEPQWVIRVLDDPSVWMHAKATKKADRSVGSLTSGDSVPQTSLGSQTRRK